LKEFSEDLGIDLIRFSKNFPLKKYFKRKIENPEKYLKRKKEEYKEGERGKEIKTQKHLVARIFFINI